jgi:hypothetical protein
MEKISGIAALYAEFFRGYEAGIGSFRSESRSNRAYNYTSTPGRTGVVVAEHQAFSPNPHPRSHTTRQSVQR